jgi:alanyl-tRNA synthetase
MKSNKIRKLFLEFFKANDHKILRSSPIVVKNDPSLMFTNAGMNQFKNFFLGIDTPEDKRVSNSQKCIRVSGKHNDLEQVGHDTYHHTMFEMLGNWSFGDYSKEKAISLAWDFLTKECKLDKERLYVSVFKGDDVDNINMDSGSLDVWKNYLEESNIVTGDKKDNFWEMGDIGPCGPCTEIHYDNRPENEMVLIPGKDLINKDHPDVIEIWNLVFIQYDRKKDGSLKKLPTQHVDTGMGFERLCMIMQNVRSNYETDLFQPLIQEISILSKKKYGEDEKNDIAMRVIADHIRAVAFSIADGQLPSNIKAGYVIRRILRRAIRYAYTFLDLKHPFIYELVDVLEQGLGDYYGELSAQKELISSVIKQEEESFLRTLDRGLKKIEVFATGKSNISGAQVFELYDTYGFPKDLTRLILKEKNIDFDEDEFDAEMSKQQNRSKESADNTVGEWEIISKDNKEEFIGYDSYEVKTIISRYRTAALRGKDVFHICLNQTPFYPEGGGQIGDTGLLSFDKEEIRVIDTKKENNLIYHIVERLPSDISLSCLVSIDLDRREAISRNHTATHLLHAQLRSSLGDHVVQKGSLVSETHLRFDFSHFTGVDQDQLKNIESSINSKILKNILLLEKNNILLSEAKKLGALMLFGEKYGDRVRLIQFNESKELCGGTHVNSTGEIGLFKITTETSVASGIRRIEAITGFAALDYLNNQDKIVYDAQKLLKNKDIITSITKLKDTNLSLEKELKVLQQQSLSAIANKLLKDLEPLGGVNYIYKKVDFNIKLMKEMSFYFRKQDRVIAVLAAQSDDKAFISIIISDDLVKEGLDATIYINDIAKEISGSGGGQSNYATAGGTNMSGISKALKKAKELFSK